MVRLSCCFAILLVTGCASLSKDECRVAQWREIGFTDAAKGYSASRIGEHRAACASTAVSVNFDEYTAGYNLGLDKYCQPSTAYKLGSQNSAYPSQCDSQRFPALVKAYSFGGQQYQLKEQRTTMQREYQDKLAQVRAVNGEIEESRTTPNGSKSLHSHQEALKGLRNDLYTDIAKLEQKLQRLDQSIQSHSYLHGQN